MANPIPPLAHAPTARPPAQRADHPPRPAAQRPTTDRAEISSGAVRLADAAARGGVPVEQGAIDALGEAIAEFDKAAPAKAAADRAAPPLEPPTP